MAIIETTQIGDTESRYTNTGTGQVETLKKLDERMIAHGEECVQDLLSILGLDSGQTKSVTININSSDVITFTAECYLARNQLKQINTTLRNSKLEQACDVLGEHLAKKTS